MRSETLWLQCYHAAKLSFTNKTTFCEREIGLQIQNTVKEHYVPQFYLKNFADDNGLLHIYDFKKKKIFTQSAKNICYENNLYETKWENSNPKFGEFVLQNHIENIFCKYEGEFSKVLSKILLTCTPSQNLRTLILHG